MCDGTHDEIRSILMNFREFENDLPPFLLLGASLAAISATPASSCVTGAASVSTRRPFARRGSGEVGGGSGEFSASSSRLKG